MRWPSADRSFGRIATSRLLLSGKTGMPCGTWTPSSTGTLRLSLQRHGKRPRPCSTLSVQLLQLLPALRPRAVHSKVGEEQLAWSVPLRDRILPFCSDDLVIV